MTRLIQRRKLMTASLLVGLVAGMAGLAYAAVPLYRLFCRVTGYAGAIQRTDSAPVVATNTDVTVRFNADIDGDLPWSFQPVESQVTLKVGQERMAYYRVKNLTDQRLAGSATFNVTPFSAGPYFAKVQCFCFEEQVLEPGESADLPVTFYVDPAMLDDPETAVIRTITLSYTFFRAQDDTAQPADTASDDPGAAQSSDVVN